MNADGGDSATRPSLASAAAVIDTRKRLDRALGSNFAVGELVGRGGFAEVFSVRDLRLKRDLAVKVLSPELVVNATMLARFRREAEAVAALRHPSIVPIYDIGESGGIAYIVMPLIQGETLRKRIDRDERVAIPEVRRILREIAGALHIAHAAGLVHRDIKPENVMLEGPRQQVLVMDFGIAKALDPESTGMTSSGLIVGTPHYMSPEQASGDPVDGRSDEYSLAVLGYRMLTGTHPFEGETARALLYKQVFEQASPARDRFPDIPQALSDALHRGMAKDPKERFATIEDFAAAIAVEDTAEYLVRASSAKLAAKALAAKTEVKKPVAAKSRSSRRMTSILGIGALAILGTIAIYAVSRLSPESGTDAAVVPPEATPAAPAPVVPSSRTPLPPSQTLPDSGPGAPRETRPVPPKSEKPVVTKGPAVGASAASRTPRPVPADTPTPKTCTEAVAASAWTAALTQCQAEAQQGNMPAQLALAGMFEKGHGTAADATTAAGWYRKAADAGSADAAFRLATMLEEGRGVDKNTAEAANYYQQAARRGSAPAMRAIARMFATGDGVRRNDAEAINWYRRAVAANDVPSLVRLGEIYTIGRGTSKNEAEAARLFTRAAEAGDPEGQYSLALAYFGGRGVARSDSLGLAWLQKAASKGLPAAQQELTKRQK
jgi:serine/threonine-protein kinase